MYEILLARVIQAFVMFGFCIIMHITMKKFRPQRPKLARQIWIPLSICFFVGVVWPLYKHFMINTFAGNAMLYASPGARLLYSIAIFNMITPLLGLIGFVYFIVLVGRYFSTRQNNKTPIS